MIWAPIIAAIVGAAANAGAAAAWQPDVTSPGQQSRRLTKAQMQFLPIQRKLEAAAKLGQRVEYEVKQHGKTVKKVADFTGLGDAEIQGELSRQLAQVQLELGQQYGVDFAKEARAQQELADPEGAAARKMLADQIVKMDDGRQTMTRPVAGALDAQIQGELAAGRSLNPESEAAIAEVLSRRGGTTIGAGDVANEMETGLAGDARMSQRIKKALNYYGSGVTPIDSQFRDRQQSIANMASFLGGRTPQSQFGNMAQGGAAPMPQGGALPNVGNNQAANAAGMQAFKAGAGAAGVNPYMAGLAMLVQGAGTAAQAGWKPFGK